MAVRVQKSAVNIREKLAELERPIGINGAALMATNTPQDAFSLIGAGRRNLVINGDMRIDQRNSGASVSAAAGVYPVDRFEIENITGGGTATTQRSTTVPTGQGFTNSLLVTVTGTDTSLASTDFYTVRHITEGQNISHLNFGSSSALPVTISFWVRSSIPGIYCFSLTNGGNSRGYPVEYTISLANTWEKKVITIPGDVSGTWGTDNGRGIQCRFCMGTGTSRQGTANSWNAGEIHGTSNQTNLFAINGSTFYLTGVQLEQGKVATPFEYRSYGQELALCQRYFLKSNNAEGTVYESGGNTGNVGLGMAFPVEMRTTPSVTFGSSTNNVHTYGSGDNSYSGQNAIYMTPKGARMYMTGGSARTVGTFSVLLIEASFSAEL